MKKQTTAQRRRRFERIVVLVDVTVVLLQHEPKKIFAAHVFNSVSRILQQCNQHSKSLTLWGYKFFDPFHHPLASRSKIGAFLEGTPMSAQFDAFAPNLQKFGKVLDVMVNSHKEYIFEGSSRGDYVARVINEVIGDYSWDPLLASDSSSSEEETLASKERLGGDGAKRDSNAIILFSSVPTTWTGANCFFNLPQLVGDGPPDPSAQILLAKTFRTAREAVKSRNIQVCFVDVPMHQGLWSDERLEAVLKPTAARSLILKSLSDLVRTVIASDLLAVSPALVPSNLVWNTVADLGIEKSGKKTRARILCQGATLLCEVQLQPFNVVHVPSTSKGMSVLKTKLHPATIDKLDIVLESVQPKSSLDMTLTSERFLVRQSVRPKLSVVGEDRDSFGDKVLQLLDQSAFRPGQPVWQLLLLTLASIKSVCEVSLRIHEGSHSLRAVLEPFTSQCAILTLFEIEIIPTKTDRPPTLKKDIKGEPVPGQGDNTKKRTKDVALYAKHEGVVVLPRKRRKVAASAEAVINWQERWEGEGTISASTEFASDSGSVLSRYIQGGKASQSLQIIDSFFKERPQPNREIDLVGPLAVMAVGVEPSAVQACAAAAHPDNNDGVVHPGIVSRENAEAKDFVRVQEASEILSVGDARVQEDSNAVVGVHTPAQEAHPISSMACQMTSEEAKEYIASVGQKVEDYLTSTDFDSRRFAGKLVAESYRSLSVLTRQTEDDQRRSDTGKPAEVDLNRKLAVKLTKLLLKSHKRLLAKYKNCVGSPSGATSAASADDKVKEYELQILFRLEMISFDEGVLLEQLAKDQLTKDVCNLLEIIRFHLPGGIFGGKHFLNYCDRLLVSRYQEKITSTISKIYSVMELDGYSALPPTDSAPASYQETSVQASNQETSVEAGVSLDIICCSDRTSNSATGGLPSRSLDPEYAASQPTLERRSNGKSSREDSKGQVQSRIFEKGPKKKGFYHYGTTHSLVRTFKRSARHIPAHSKPSKGRSCPTAPVTNDPVQVVCQTPAPTTAPSSLRAGHEPQLRTLAPPKEFTGYSPKQVSGEQLPSVVEGTPVVKRRLTLHNFGQEDVTGNAISLDDMVADIDRTSDAVPNLSAACPSKLNISSLGPEPCKKSVPSDVSSGRKQGIHIGKHTALLTSFIPPRTEVEKLGSRLGRHITHNKDDDVDDDDDDGIISTPFKVNASGQSLRSLQFSQSDRPDCHKRLAMRPLKVCP